MGRRSEMEEVELLEHGDDPSAQVDEVDRARGVVTRGARGGLAWIRRHPVLSATTVVVAAVAIAVPVTLTTRAERARTAALALLPGVVAPMPEAPGVAWTAPQAPGIFALSLFDHAWVRDGALILWEQTGDASQSLRALDAGTGDELWTAALSSVPDLGDPGSRSTYDPTSCVAPPADPGPGVVVCVVPDSWQLGTPDDVQLEEDVVATTTLVQPASVRLRAFAVATGETVLDRPVTDGSSLVAVGGDVVVAQTPESGVGPATLQRLDPATGAQRWSVDFPRPRGDSGSPYASVRLFDDQIAVDWLEATTVLRGDGSVADEHDTDYLWRASGHTFAIEGDTSTQLRDVDSGQVIDLGRSYFAWVATDDGSMPDTLLVQADERVGALDLVTGEQRWRAAWPSTSTLSLVIADGRVVRLSDDALTVLDAGTGRQLWRLPIPAYGQNVVTDGRRLLVLESGPDTGRVVASYGLRDGRREWEAPIPVAVQSLAVVDHRLFGVGSGGLVAFTNES